LAVFLLVPGLKLTMAAEQKTFPTPRAAITALVVAMSARASDQVFAILGPELEAFVSTRDKPQNEIDRQDFLDDSTIIRFEKKAGGSNEMIAYLGKTEWPFPAPLVKTASGWKFDGRAALQEIQDRQIGRNEVGAIAACQAYIDAQFEYFSKARMDDGYLQFAQRINSTAGKFDGLYWSNANGEDESPIGPFSAQAAGAELEPPDEVPFSGYYFKILNAQGESAVGGERSYLVDGRMITGFALVAWPAEYRGTGVATIICNQLGIVYQQDLGPDTAQIARKMNQFNPGNAWTKVE
jgi:hypothetical protein